MVQTRTNILIEHSSEGENYVVFLEKGHMRAYIHTKDVTLKEAVEEALHLHRMSLGTLLLTVEQHKILLTLIKETGEVL